MFVHGEDAKMEFLKEKVENEFHLPVYKPANGESIIISTPLDVHLDVPLSLIERSIRLDPTPSKRFCPFRACIVMDKPTAQLDVVSSEMAAKQLGLDLHTITFSETISVTRVDWNRLVDALRSFDNELERKDDGIELFNGEIMLATVHGSTNEIEVIWDECREDWLPYVTQAIVRVSSSS